MSRKKKIIQQEIPVLEALPEQGLTTEEVQLRQKSGYANVTADSVGRSEWQIIAQNLFTFFNLVFAVLALALALVGAHPKNMTFLIIVFCNICIGCYQEIRAKRAVDKLTLVAAQKIYTVRNGEMSLVHSEKLVRDDVVEFVVGNQICADGILLTGFLQVNESLLTGEEDLVTKMPGDVLYSGSFVVAGKGRARLTAVGEDSFSAKLSRAAKADPRAAKSEMMRSLDKLIRWVGIILIPVGLVLFYHEYFVLENGLTPSTRATVTALVGMIPEGLYLLTSVAMAASSLKLTRDKVLVKDLHCIEALARVDVLCVDKTGTITEPGMELEQVINLSNREDLTEILTAIYSGTEAENDTAQALVEKFSGASDWVCTKRIPFTSQTKWSAAMFEKQGAFVVGAPEMVMGGNYEDLRGQVEQWLDKGSRVLLLASHADACTEKLEQEKIQPIALLVLSNRIRATAAKTFQYFKEQGVQIKVISGDNPMTVSRVAQRAGIEDGEKYIDATTLKSLEDIEQAAEKYTVFGRVTPEQKKQLLMALKKAGHTVAMTGDGVNDVLALREADCSVAMASGAQAASQVSQLVLVESDFAAMPAIVGEGRRVINNIQRAAALFLVKNILSLGLSLSCLISGQPYPFVPLHLSILSCFTIGVPSFFLAMEPNYERVYGAFLPSVLRRALPGGLTGLIMVISAQLIMSNLQIPSAQISTACTALASVTGMLVLAKTCYPFRLFRHILWWAMAGVILFCFTVARSFFEIAYGPWETTRIMLVMMAITPVVFFVIGKIVDLFAKLKKK